MKNEKTVLKGAAELIIASCDTSINSAGDFVEIDREKYLREYRKLASVGSRVIGIAVYDERKASKTLVALISMKDKIRQGAHDAVKRILSAGIQIVMITGDSKETASAIAKECGILRNESREIILTADELSSMSDDDIKAILPRLRVVARALPRDKSRLFTCSFSSESIFCNNE